MRIQPRRRRSQLPSAVPAMVELLEVRRVPASTSASQVGETASVTPPTLATLLPPATGPSLSTAGLTGVPFDPTRDATNPGLNNTLDTNPTAPNGQLNDPVAFAFFGASSPRHSWLSSRLCRG